MNQLFQVSSSPHQFDTLQQSTRKLLNTQHPFFSQLILKHFPQDQTYSQIFRIKYIKTSNLFIGNQQASFKIGLNSDYVRTSNTNQTQKLNKTTNKMQFLQLSDLSFSRIITHSQLRRSYIQEQNEKQIDLQNIFNNYFIEYRFKFDQNFTNSRNNKIGKLQISSSNDSLFTLKTFLQGPQNSLFYCKLQPNLLNDSLRLQLGLINANESSFNMQKYKTQNVNRVELLNQKVFFTHKFNRTVKHNSISCLQIFNRVQLDHFQFSDHGISYSYEKKKMMFQIQNQIKRKQDQNIFEVNIGSQISDQLKAMLTLKKYYSMEAFINPSNDKKDEFNHFQMALEYKLDKHLMMKLRIENFKYQQLLLAYNQGKKRMFVSVSNRSLEKQQIPIQCGISINQ